MSEQQRDTAFLTRLISYDDSAERHRLAARIARLQSDERCVRRAAWLMALFAGLATCGICYAAVFLIHPMNLLQFMEQFTIKVLCAIALGSSMCLLAFLGLSALYRLELARHREECRSLAMRMMEARLGNPRRATGDALADDNASSALSAALASGA